jgi:AcrR family transcriptional regulator
VARSGSATSKADRAAQPKRVITRSHPEVRHDELIQATIRCLVSNGPLGTTVRAIAAEADVSPGLITYHFGGKQSLLTGAYSYLSVQIRQAERQALEAASDDPLERLLTFLRVGFDPRFLNEEYITARFLFWGLAKSDEAVARVHGDIYSEYRRDLGELIENLVGTVSARDRLVFAMSAFLDGLWLEWLLDPECFDVDDMLAACRHMIMGFAADHPVAAAAAAAATPAS